MHKAIGFWRLEAAFQTMEWGLPFSFTAGKGGLTFMVLCLEFVYWRGKFRYRHEGY